MKHSNDVKKAFASSFFISGSIRKEKDKILCNDPAASSAEKPLNNLNFTCFKKPAVKLILYLVIPVFLSLMLMFSGCDAISAMVSSNMADSNTGAEQGSQQKDIEDGGQENQEKTAESGDGAAEDSTKVDESDEQSSENSSDGDGQEPEEQKAAEIEIEPTAQTINVYYADSSGENLVGEARDLEGTSKLVDAIYELMKDPVDSSLFVLIPSTTKINSVKAYEDGIAEVDLSQSFLDDRIVSDTVDILLLYSIVNTLTEFDEISAVKLYIDGKKLDIIGQLDIKDPVYRRSDLIQE